jgi:hypothetical protein
MSVDSFDSYRLYQSLKLHFETDSYDAVKYNFKTSASPQSFFKRRDKYFFAKVGKKMSNQQDLVSFYVANFINEVSWVGEMVNGEGDRHYAHYKKIHESLSYNFKNDINNLDGSLDDLLTSVNGEHPPIIKRYLQGDILLESVAILNKMTGFMNRANKQITETLLWPDVYRKVTKYQSFVNPDVKKCKKIGLEGFTS